MAVGAAFGGLSTLAISRGLKPIAVFCRRLRRRAHHISRNTNLVRRSEQARMDPAELGVPGRVECTLSIDGRELVAGLGSLCAEQAASIAIGLFLGQLALNAAWSPVFFALHLTQVALLIIIALAVLLAATTYHTLAVNRAAAWLLVPYLLWILYALTLNAGIVTLNP